METPSPGSQELTDTSIGAISLGSKPPKNSKFNEMRNKLRSNYIIIDFSKIDQIQINGE